MAYYNRNYEKLKLKDMKYLNCGECAKILHNEKIILKEYFSDTVHYYRLNEKMFDILKEINNPHFIELFDIYTDFSFTELLKNKIGIMPFSIDAYTAKYYQDNSVNVLLESKDYILENFKELEALFNIFSKNMVCTDDIKKDNTVIGKDGIVIIDPDLFYTINSPIDFISLLNKKNLLNLFRSIITNSIIVKQNYGKFIAFIDTELVNIEVTNNTNITDEISKKLKYVKKPIEIFKK